jgi:hypothetical protein
MRIVDRKKIVRGDKKRLAVQNWIAGILGKTPTWSQIAWGLEQPRTCGPLPQWMINGKVMKPEPGPVAIAIPSVRPVLRKGEGFFSRLFALFLNWFLF